ncbi:hypothetical protein AC578_7879 [Pseudocercospora eumusae]|uniref:Chromatin modification-related protein n=1 Tax=Pseudocercospora eumusae TaxID=321146 RepID=A0A139H085_9PEZI|nr:hypothetical protein AC578_7879 [Pseudocercospora eumusae]
MPFYSSVRKTSATTGMNDANTSYPPNGSNGTPRQPRTTASGRAVRANTTRPANYYARPFANPAATAHHHANADNAAPQQPDAFYPGITFFTDAITALPKEVQKQFTLMKEVEAKIHGPAEQIGQIIDQIMDMPVPRRKDTSTSAAQNGPTQGLLSLTANNSTSGSANVSLVNGQAGRHSAHASVSGSVDGEQHAESEEDRQKRLKCYELRAMTSGLLANLDEKIVVLSEANRVLKLQHMRLDSVMPQLENEISEEARLGSMTHWAYFDNRQKTKAVASSANRQRDVAAMNSLAVAGNMLHEQEIANVRTNAGKEATREKRGGKRAEHAGDSDFDDKPRKVAKVGKGKAAAGGGPAGLGISTNGEPATKRRKPADKGLAAPGMERTVSAPGKGAKARDTPRSTPAAEPTAKTKAAKPKPGPTGPKRKMPASAQNSPMLASSPLAASFSPAMAAASLDARPSSSRMRQNSSATNLRHERLRDEDENDSRPSSAAGDKALPKINGRKKVQETTEEHEQITREEPTELSRQQREKLKREDTETRYASGNEKDRPVNSRSGSNSRKNSGRNSKVSTPRTESFPISTALGGEAMARSRSTRSKAGDRDDSSSEPQQGSTTRKGMHKRNASNSHLVKQLAPFNKSPNLDRNNMDEEMESDDDEKEDNEADGQEAGEEDQREARRASARRPVSRRNTVNSTTLRTSPAPASRDSSRPASPPTATRQNTRSSQRGTAASPKENTPPLVQDDDEDESEHDPDDPDEPKYCYCNRGSYGEMVACDNDNCPREWFHLGCTELKEAPEVEEKWYCRDCRPKGRGGRGGARGGRGRLVA